MKKLLLVCLILFPVGCKQEARFQGFPTSYWIKELKNPSYVARMRAANALSNLGPEAKQAIPDLIELLGDSEPLVRWAAADTLGHFGSDARDALPTLKKLAAEDKDPRARASAEWAVKAISTPANPQKTEGAGQ